MPELPEVEVFKRYIDATSLHQKIGKVEVRSGMILKGVSGAKFKKTLQGYSFESTKRHGKHLFVSLTNGSCLFFHFGMTGYLKYGKDKEEDLPHSRIILKFTNGFKLVYVDQRLFGNVSLGKDIEHYIKRKRLGPDATKLDFKSFKNILLRRKGSVKSALMNQKLIAGIGNIYADEILFQSGIHPMSRSEEIDNEGIKNLFRKMNRVLQTAIKCRAEYEGLPESYLIKRRDKNGRCPKCDTPLRQIKVTGRTTYYCSRCQKKN